MHEMLCLQSHSGAAVVHSEEMSRTSSHCALLLDAIFIKMLKKSAHKKVAVRLHLCNTQQCGAVQLECIALLGVFGIVTWFNGSRCFDAQQNQLRGVSHNRAIAHIIEPCLISRRSAFSE